MPSNRYCVVSRSGSDEPFVVCPIVQLPPVRIVTSEDGVLAAVSPVSIVIEGIERFMGPVHVAFRAAPPDDSRFNGLPWYRRGTPAGRAMAVTLAQALGARA